MRPAEPTRGTALYDHAAASYDTRLRARPHTLRRLRVIEAPLRRLAMRATRVLDLGCGTGRLAVELRALRVVGVDISFGMVRQAAAKGVCVSCADAHALPFERESFDLVLAANAVFGHLERESALRECARVLRAGGRLACHQYAARVWSPRRPFTRPLPGHRRDLESIRDFQREARAFGLQLVAVHLWRGLRVWPHIVRIPRLLATRLWDHGVFVFEKVGRPQVPPGPHADT